ncbi:hypothetical protein JNK13_07745 [bacterium]|nr:hypothetical protein [bacterium]
MQSNSSKVSLNLLPGGDLVLKGLSDLKSKNITDEALLVLIASERLSGLGIKIPQTTHVPTPYEHTLYTQLNDREPKRAFSIYNSLIRRIVSFAQALSLEAS